MRDFIRKLIARLLRREMPPEPWLGREGRPRGPAGDPHAWKPVPRTRRPNNRSGAVAVAEPDDDRIA